MRNGQIDFYVGPVNPEKAEKDFLVEKLFDNQRYIYARKGHPLANASRLEELRGAKWLKPTGAGRAIGDFTDPFVEQGLPRPHDSVHTDSILSTLLAIAKTDLLAQLPSVWRGYSPLSDYLVALEKIGPLDAPPICIVRRRDLPLTPLAGHLSDLMRRAAGHYAHRQKMAVQAVDHEWML